MGLVGEMPGEQEGVPSGKVWYRCTKCRQAFLFDLEVLAKEREIETQKLDLKDCTEYSPAKTYSLGEAIFHTDWSDVGKVKAKERTSSGAHAILVAFEKLGERKLIENLKPEETPQVSADEPITPSNFQSSQGNEVI